MNQSKEDGDVVRFEIVPLNDGSDPTQPPVSYSISSNDGSQLTCDQHNLPPLHSFNTIESLNGRQLLAYLNGYGVVPPVGAKLATDRFWKETLKCLVGASHHALHRCWICHRLRLLTQFYLKVCSYGQFQNTPAIILSQNHQNEIIRMRSHQV